MKSQETIAMVKAWGKYDKACDVASAASFRAGFEAALALKKKPKWATFRDWLIYGGYISAEDDGCPTELLREMVAWEAARK